MGFGIKHENVHVEALQFYALRSVFGKMIDSTEKKKKKKTKEQDCPSRILCSKFL